MGRPGPKLVELVLSDVERQVLGSWERGQSTPQALALRARIVLACAVTEPTGLPRSATAVAGEVGVTTETVAKWRRRFLQGRLDGLGDAPRPGRVRTVTDEQVAELVRATLETKPKNATHWSTRSMASRVGLSQSTVSRVWRAFGLQPHRAESFKLSTDPFFVDKVHDVVGLYLDPPERAWVLCVDEKSQIQALDRSQPVLPMMPGVPERASHDYVRSGTTTLFAALDMASGKVIGSLHRRQKWLLAHPRFQLHFTPTSSSWLNMVERWFAEMTNKKLRRGVHRSVQALERDIRAWIADWNDNPRPYVWTKSADQILESLAAYCRRIKDSGH